LKLGQAVFAGGHGPPYSWPLHINPFALSSVAKKRVSKGEPSRLRTEGLRDGERPAGDGRAGAQQEF
jgi:hypothetical protein